MTPFHRSVPSRFVQLSTGYRRLVQEMQSLHFGSIENLTIRSGEPVFDPAPAIVREIKLGSDDAPAPRGPDDFLLKRQVVELIEQLTRLGDGIVPLIEVKHGLPFRVFLRTSAA